MMSLNLTIAVEHADILDFACDVLILKYAQAFYGADAVVAGVLANTSSFCQKLCTRSIRRRPYECSLGFRL